MESLGVNGAFWHGKRVLVTGHTGFKGGWLSLWLKALGAAVSGYALHPPTNPSLYGLAKIDTITDTTLADIRDARRLKQALRRCRPEIVFHLAAQSLVQAGYRDPVATYQTNILGTVHLLEAIRSIDTVHAVVIVTSDKCYRENPVLSPYAEDHPMGGDDPYSSSKGCAELITVAYRSAFFQAGVDGGDRPPPAIATARAGNVIGGGDWSEARLIPDIVRGLLYDRLIRLRCPDAVRPWQHLLCPLEGYLLLAERLYQEGAAFSGAWNFGPEPADFKTAGDLADAMLSGWGSARRWTADPAEHPHESPRLTIDSTKAKARLGWRSKIPLNTGLAWTVAWYKAYQNNQAMRAVTEAQIRAYQEPAAVCP